MPLDKLDCDSIGNLHHGFAREIINAALQTAIKDTDDRGSDGKLRKVTIEISFVKIGDGAVKIGLTADPRGPKYQIDDTVATINAPTKRGMAPEFAFRSDSPERPDQQTFDDARN